MKDQFIVEIEGGEGSGKSTLINGLKKIYPNAIFSREPGGTAVAEKIRSLIVNEEMTPTTEALLFAAARAEHVNELKDKTGVIFLDRYFESSLVYQGHVKGVPSRTLIEMNRSSLEQMRADVIIYLDIRPEDGLKRIAVNKRETNRFDKEAIDFHNKVRDGFLCRANEDERYVVINANQQPELVLRDVCNCLVKYFFDIVA